MAEDGADAAAAAFAEWRERLAAAEPAADLVATERYFAAACAAGVVPPLTLDEADLPQAPEDTRERCLAVYDRLRRLGYAPLPAERTAEWSALRAAFAEFQREAGLDGPGHVAGELTLADWCALQQIFNFETTLEVARWFADGRPSAALERAARLRLSVLGFGPPPTPADWRVRSAQWTDFVATARVFGFAPAPDAMGLTPAGAVMLFAHEAMVARIAAWSDPVPDGERPRRFLLCLAKVELWLHGFDLVPDGDAALTVRTFRAGRHGRWTDEPSPVARSIVRAAEDLFADPETGPRRLTVPAQRIPELVPMLLAKLAGLERAAVDERAAAERNSAALVGTLEARLVAEPGLWQRLCEVGRLLTAKLYDGMRRVLAWLTRFFARARAWTVNALANAWRALYHFGSGAASRLRRALRVVAEGAEFFTARVVTDPARQIVCWKRVDLDARVVVDDAVSAADAGRFAAGLRRRARALGLACRIVRLVATALRAALAGAAAALGGFVPLLFGLASAYTQVCALTEALEAFEQAAPDDGLCCLR